MNLIVCIDNNKGLMFNNRRPSKDIKVIEDIKKLINKNKIICSKYSSSLFQNEIDVEIIDKVQEKNNTYYFHENLDNYKEIKYDKIIIYNWNRDYPKDKIFDYDLTDYKIVDIQELNGNSHDKITKIIYERDGYYGKEELQ